MANDLKKTFEQASVIYSFVGDIKGKSVLFGPSKNKIQQGRSEADDLDSLISDENEELSIFENLVTRKRSTFKVSVMILAVVVVTSLIVLSTFSIKRISDQEKTRNRNDVTVGSNRNKIQEAKLGSTKSSTATDYTWKTLKSYIIKRPWTSFQAYYAGHRIKCDGSGNFHFFQFRWGCRCIDLLTITPVNCNYYTNPGAACQRALAQLVRTMNKAKVYPLPTDAVDMNNGC